MAEPTFTPVKPNELAEIPAFVVRPLRPDTRYHAPRLSRSAMSLQELRDLHERSLGNRLMNGWRQQRGLEIETAEEQIGELRHHAPRVRYNPVGPAPVDAGSSRSPWVGRTAACVALLTAAGALGWKLGTQMQPAQALSTRLIPASVLIASQNLPRKLPRIEQAAPTAALEEGHRLSPLTYVVQAGDSFRSIGARFSLTPRTVRLVNQLSMDTQLKIGQTLTITPGDGAMITSDPGETLEEIAKRYDLDAKGLRAANPGLKEKEKNNEKVLASGQTIFLPGVQEIKTVLSNLHQGEPGFRGYRNDHNTGTGAQRLEASRSLIGQFGSRVGALSWPAAGQISSPFGIRGYSFHPGMDICNAAGTQIHAAKAGTVVASGWSSGYGYAIDIDHGGGIVTRYGHCSRLLVSAGQKVEEGQEIALMGSTGFSTGPHVHFEVRIQGRAVNPASFL